MQAAGNIGIELPTDKVVREVLYLPHSGCLAVLTSLDVRIYDEGTNYLKMTIRRLATPRTMAAGIQQPLIVIHYSDNYCIVYDTQNWEQISVIVGTPKDHRGLIFTQNDFQVVFANYQSLQMWEIFTSSVVLFTQQLKNVNCYSANEDGLEIYCGTYRGQVTLVYGKKVKGYSSRIPIIQVLPVFDKSVMGIQYCANSYIVAISMSCQIAIMHSKEHKISLINRWRLGSGLNTVMPVSILYDGDSKLFVKINSDLYEVDIHLKDKVYMGLTKRIEPKGELPNSSFLKTSNNKIYQANWKANILNLYPE